MFGKRVKYLRNKRGISQERVADAIGISRARYAHYENNRVEPDLDLIRKIADYYDVTTDYLMGRTENTEFNKENDKTKIIYKIATEFPDADLMFNDLANMTAEQLEDVYDYIKFKQSKKGD
nr:helix-turn-helix transcriptional regulator [Virgibacillus doumboii]